MALCIVHTAEVQVSSQMINVFGRTTRDVEEKAESRKDNSRQTFQGSAVASPCLLTDTAKHGPAEKVGCPSDTADESES